MRQFLQKASHVHVMLGGAVVTAAGAALFTGQRSASIDPPQFGHETQSLRQAARAGDVPALLRLTEGPSFPSRREEQSEVWKDILAMPSLYDPVFVTKLCTCDDMTQPTLGQIRDFLTAALKEKTDGPSARLAGSLLAHRELVLAFKEFGVRISMDPDAALGMAAWHAMQAIVDRADVDQLYWLAAHVCTSDASRAALVTNVSLEKLWSTCVADRKLDFLWSAVNDLLKNAADTVQPSMVLAALERAVQLGDVRNAARFLTLSPGRKNSDALQLVQDRIAAYEADVSSCCFDLKEALAPFHGSKQFHGPQSHLPSLVQAALVHKPEEHDVLLYQVEHAKFETDPENAMVRLGKTSPNVVLESEVLLKVAAADALTQVRLLSLLCASLIVHKRFRAVLDVQRHFHGTSFASHNNVALAAIHHVGKCHEEHDRISASQALVKGHT
jgi:hypothetical protein